MDDAERIGRQRPAPRRRARFTRSMAIWSWIVGLCLASLVASYVMFVEPPPPRHLVIAGGSRGGAYFRHATAYAEELRREGLDVAVRETAGSVENLELLVQDGSGVSIGIVQSGVADEAQAARLLALGSLYREPLWVFYRGDRTIDRPAQLEGLRIGVGPEGSGTLAVTMRLLAANGIGPEPTTPGGRGTRLTHAEAANAAEAFSRGELDAAFFVAAFEADYIRRLIADPAAKLMSFAQQEAYRRRFRYLSPVTLPAGVVDLGKGIPARDVALLAPTAMLVVRGDFSPALVPVLLAAATRIHGGGSVLSEPGEFPSESYCDIPLSEDARRFYRSGQPFLQRLLPFWLASLADRAKLMLIPLVMLLMPMLRAAPPLIRWRTRRKIYRWYSVLREIDQKLAAGLGGLDLDRELQRLRNIEHKVVWVEVPLSYMEEFYQLRMHLSMMQQRLLDLRDRGEPADEPS
ncbi:NMT1/THI5 like protein [Aquisphaera giovannonii]|uniref:NMT1/THI5 like protein n=1 Tax=Aquisphaera giovannonii TaxID=406548 RepID=A0A5B9WAB4_9BACT|nr:TAXI family TRAP transporter solute-binding subunit [Aquisphaera giovannonii]QEH37179.1 NMT1/THI5 like protein [Aquisphaera giovannonii]